MMHLRISTWSHRLVWENIPWAVAQSWGRHGNLNHTLSMLQYLRAPGRAEAGSYAPRQNDSVIAVLVHVNPATERVINNRADHLKRHFSNLWIQGDGVPPLWCVIRRGMASRVLGSTRINREQLMWAKRDSCNLTCAIFNCHAPQCASSGVLV